MRVRVIEESEFRLSFDRDTDAKWAAGRVRLETLVPPNTQIIIQVVAGYDDDAGRAVQAEAAAGGGGSRGRATPPVDQDHPGPVLHSYPPYGAGPWRPHVGGAKGKD